MNRELKDILLLFLIILPAFLLVYVGWLHSPMYQHTIEQQREAAREYLSRNYYFTLPAEKKELMKIYGITDEEVNPINMFKGLREAQDEESN